MGLAFDVDRMRDCRQKGGRWDRPFAVLGRTGWGGVRTPAGGAGGSPLPVLAAVPASPDPASPSQGPGCTRGDRLAARPPGQRRRGPAPRGFSLLEVLLVVTLLGVMALLVVPGVSLYRSNTRAREAAYTILRVARQAQAMAFRDGVAWYLRYDAAAANGHGALFRYRGMNNRCDRVDWAQAIGSGGASPADGHGNFGEYADMLDYNRNSASPSASDVNRHIIKADVYIGGSATATPVVNICYEPSGRVLSSTTTATAGPFALQQARIMFEVALRRNGSNRGIPRRVVFPPGAPPMIHQGER